MEAGNVTPFDRRVTVDASELQRDRLLETRLADARAISHASEGLAEAHPALSARSGLTGGQSAGAKSFIAALATFLVLAPDALVFAGFAACTGLFTVIIALRLAAAIMAMSPQPQPTAAKRALDDDLPVLTYLVPLYREANVVGELVSAILSIDYPASRLDVKLLVESDDEETIFALRRLHLPAHFEILPVPPSLPRTKPKALNHGLAHARGEIIAVLDAEDRPDHLQAREAAAALMTGGPRLAVVQAPLLAHNACDSWITSQFAVEYAIHFRVWLPFLARLGWPLALGGTSNYFRRDRLEAAGGWDAWNVTEDADIGLRLARQGDHAATIASPTWEEAPIRWKDWLAQRTRWMKGHLQTWLVLTRDPGLVVAEIGLMRFVGIVVTLGGSLIASLLHAPILIWLLVGGWTGLAPVTGLHAALLGIGYGGAVAAAWAAGPEGRRWSSLATFPLYWPLMSIAMAKALIDLKRRPHFWAKTPHGVRRPTL